MGAAERALFVLSPRQWEVLNCAMHGLTVKQTALKLGIQPCTVKEHRAIILAKLKAVNMAQAIHNAYTRPTAG